MKALTPCHAERKVKEVKHFFYEGFDTVPWQKMQKQTQTFSEISSERRKTEKKRIKNYLRSGLLFNLLAFLSFELCSLYSTTTNLKAQFSCSHALEVYS